MFNQENNRNIKETLPLEIEVECPECDSIHYVEVEADLDAEMVVEHV